MGASTSKEPEIPSEQRELEGLVASTGALPLLQTSFSKLLDPQTNSVPLHSLQKCFTLKYKNVTCEASEMPAHFLGLLDQLGPSLVDQFFVTEKGGFSWLEILRGYLKCCGRRPALALLKVFLRLYAHMAAKAGIPLNLEFVSVDEDFEITGSFKVNELLMFFWICWSMFADTRTLRHSEGHANLHLPDISNLVLSAVCSGVDHDNLMKLLDSDITDLNAQLPVDLFLNWALITVPCLTDCFTQFVNTRLQKYTTSEEGELEDIHSSSGEVSVQTECNPHLLTCVRALEISLTVRGTISEEILKPYFLNGSDDAEENLLYRSSSHGRGLNRFWSNVDGYNGPLFILVSASSGDMSGNGATVRKWIIGALTQQGLENKDHFYGTSGSLYAIDPLFHAFSSAGKEKNYIYSHLHPTVRTYEAHPKPVGIAFGGTVGNERIFIDEDFAKVTVRHHAVDKTYQHGSLFPNQGFLPVDAPISEIEVWGLGGKRAKELQNLYKKREELFTEQRRKVDLKTFASWEDSPEKMMMDMMGDPNRVRREDL